MARRRACLRAVSARGIRIVHIEISSPVGDAIATGRFVAGVED
jgi:hypothetical protein